MGFGRNSIKVIRYMEWRRVGRRSGSVDYRPLVAAQATRVALWIRIMLRIQLWCGMVAKLCPSVHNATRM